MCGGQMESSYKVYDVMTSNPVSISKNETIQNAAKLMSENKIASLVVMHDTQFVGLLTERDITRKVAAENLDSSQTKVDEIMSISARTINSKSDIKDSIKIIAEINQKQLPVIDNDKLVGLLTFKDIMRVQPQLFGFVYEKYNIRETDRKPVYEGGTEGECSACGNYSFDLNDEEDEIVCNDCKSVF